VRPGEALSPVSPPELSHPLPLSTRCRHTPAADMHRLPTSTRCRHAPKTLRGAAALAMALAIFLYDMPVASMLRTSRSSDTDR
jgi:hypothetical protein